jgi:fluoride exporter
LDRLLLLMFGGALGTGARYVVNGLVSGQQLRLAGFWAISPLGTLVVNVSGCFLVGVFAAVSGPALGRLWLRPEWRDFLMIGFCGGYTTFSSYALQSLALGRDGEWLGLAANILASNLLGLAAVYFGRAAGLWLQSRGGAF